MDDDAIREARRLMASCMQRAVDRVNAVTPQAIREASERTGGDEKHHHSLSGTGTVCSGSGA